jgi:hypothetical protein
MQVYCYDKNLESCADLDHGIVAYGTLISHAVAQSDPGGKHGRYSNTVPMDADPRVDSVAANLPSVFLD